MIASVLPWYGMDTVLHPVVERAAELADEHAHGFLLDMSQAVTMEQLQHALAGTLLRFLDDVLSGR